MNFAYSGLLRVISGGQTGVDQAGIFAAHQMGIATGGTAPKGFKTDRGPNPLLAAFGLKEDPSADYIPRTLKNIKNSDGTLIIYFDADTPGTRLTMKGAADKPCYKLLLRFDLEEQAFTDWVDAQIGKAAAWIVEHQIRTLNIAGHRDERGSTALFDLANAICTSIFQRLDDINLLIRDADL